MSQRISKVGTTRHPTVFGFLRSGSCDTDEVHLILREVLMPLQWQLMEDKKKWLRTPKTVMATGAHAQTNDGNCINAGKDGCLRPKQRWQQVLTPKPTMATELMPIKMELTGAPGKTFCDLGSSNRNPVTQ